MTTPTDIRQRAISLIEQLSPDQLQAIVQLLEFLSQSVQDAPQTPAELGLLQIIQRRLPQEEQVRLEVLRDRCEWGELTQAEHQELIHYEDLLEQQNACRLEALINLAKLKNIDVIALNRQLKSDSQTLHAL
jgi:hypothetical protein